MRININQLEGKVFTIVRESDDGIFFEVSPTERYSMRHVQDCCESVDIEDINGDLNDLVGVPILYASEETNYEVPDDVSVPSWHNVSGTWTFYKFGTIKGSVTIRWYGSSNGYYSEEASIHTAP